MFNKIIAIIVNIKAEQRKQGSVRKIPNRQVVAK